MQLLPENIKNFSVGGGGLIIGGGGLNYPKHGLTMVTDFPRKSSKLQCSGEHCQCVQ